VKQIGLNLNSRKMNRKSKNVLIEQLEDPVLQSFNKFKERFRPVRHLGKGAFGSVFEVVDQFDNLPKALKIVISSLVM